MNDFTARKLGEVLAFAEVSLDTFSRGKDALIRVLGEEMYATIISENRTHAETIKKISENAGTQTLDSTIKKCEATGLKLCSMRDLYVGDQWDNATELLEWSGFFEGAALVHWALISGCAAALHQSELIALALSATNLHDKILHTASQLLTQVGTKRAVE